MEFYQTNQSKGTNTLKNRLMQLDVGKYGIGVHGIDKGNIDEKKSIATAISAEGINLNGSKTILGTAISLGTNYENGYVAREVSEYRFGNGKIASVVIAVPVYIQNGNQEKIFLGFPQRNKIRTGQQYQEHCILDRICARMRRIPPEFVLGYFYEESDGSEHFVENLSHYSYLSDEDKETLFKSCSDNMDDISRGINELILNGKTDELEEIKRRMIEHGIATYMVETAILLANKYGVKEQKTSGLSESDIKR